MNIVMKMRQNRIIHKLFYCPTFWQMKPSFKCPCCGKKYRCYWDGNDVKYVGIDLCNNCAKGAEYAVNQNLDKLEVLNDTI